MQQQLYKCVCAGGAAGSRFLANQTTGRPKQPQMISISNLPTENLWIPACCQHRPSLHLQYSCCGVVWQRTAGSCVQQYQHAAKSGSALLQTTQMRCCCCMQATTPMQQSTPHPASHMCCTVNRAIPGTVEHHALQLRWRAECAHPPPKGPRLDWYSQAYGRHEQAGPGPEPMGGVPISQC